MLPVSPIPKDALSQLSSALPPVRTALGLERRPVRPIQGARKGSPSSYLSSCGGGATRLKKIGNTTGRRRSAPAPSHEVLSTPRLNPLTDFKGNQLKDLNGLSAREVSSLATNASSSTRTTDTHRPLSENYGRGSISSNSNIDKVLESCTEKPWHCVHPDADVDGAQAGGSKQLSSGACGIPARCEAIVIFVSKPASEVARETIGDFLELEDGIPPIILVFVGLMKTQTSLEIILQEYSDYMELGVDDVILGADCCTQFAVAMSLHRIERHYETIRVLEEHERRADAQSKQIKTMQDRDNTFFFSHAHRIFNHLPEMQADLSGPPRMNSKLDCLLLSEKLGQGGFGQVWAAKDINTGADLAVKAISKASLVKMEAVEEVANEARTLHKVQGHCNITDFFGVIHARDYFYLIMGSAGCTNLFKEIKCAGEVLPPNLVRCYSSQIADAIDYCIFNGIAHRDLKPENVAVNKKSNLVQIVDFGCAVCLRPGELQHGSCGTMPFMCPEMMCGGKYDASKVDSWAWAVLVIEMMAGLGRFSDALGWPRKASASPEKAADLQILVKTPNFIREQVLSCASVQAASMDAVLEVISGALTIDSNARWSAHDIARCRWFKDD